MDKEQKKKSKDSGKPTGKSGDVDWAKMTPQEIIVSKEAYEEFVRILERPPKLKKKLREAFEKHRDKLT